MRLAEQAENPMTGDLLLRGHTCSSRLSLAQIKAAKDETQNRQALVDVRHRLESIKVLPLKTQYDQLCDPPVI